MKQKNSGKGLGSAKSMEYGAGGGLGRLQKAGMLSSGAGAPKKGSGKKKNNPY